MIVDLTMPLDSKTPTFPGDPKPEIVSFGTIKDSGVNTLRLGFVNHTGTHIDFPFHMLEEGKTLSDFPLETFVGEAIVIDVRGQKEINDSLENVKEGDMVFFFTGHTTKAYEKDFFSNYPVLSEEVTHKLIEKKVRIVGLDSPSPDYEPFEIHKLLLKQDILIVENLVNLDKVADKRFTCYILPLNITNADGAPCRVFALP